MKTLAIIQARTTSSRLPGKVLMPVLGQPMILMQLERVRKSKSIDKIVLATSDHPSDNYLAKLVSSAGYDVFRGDLNDVLKRFKDCLTKFPADNIVRLTGDCPLSDPILIDEIVNSFYFYDIDYLANCLDEENLSVPDGFDIEVFRAELIYQANSKATLLSEREHVTPWFKKIDSGFKCKHFSHKTVYPPYRLTVDYLNDFIVIKKIFSKLYSKDFIFNIDTIINFLNTNPDILDINKMNIRNEGYLKSLKNDSENISSDMKKLSKGQIFWNRAKNVIPGGNMLLSKRSEMFLPEFWPSYFTKAKGCRVWDLEHRELIDMSLMGVGTNILGYGDENVDEAVLQVISNGNMSTLNCFEEVLLAERLIDLHPWADMVRFARSGGEANAIAVRIARAHRGLDTVAICGYHGWHDWYLATNLKDSSMLTEHLLPGLEPKGVPKSLEGSVQPFSFNSLDQLEKITNEYQLAAVKMEVQRTVPPSPGFLEGVRELCNKKDIVLIFDECTSGFREEFGGLHKKYSVEPDIAIFGKALGNGYAITSVIGKKIIMESAQSTFISSTFWTERIGPVAALKTLEIMEKKKSWSYITKSGKNIKMRWKELAQKYSLDIEVNGLDALASFSFNSNYSLEYKTLISQEMLKRGFLASTACYLSVAHSKDIINEYFFCLEEVFALIASCEDGLQVNDLLDGPICHKGFSRLN
tara:strand:- start:2778 stop:4868 length:2091 start_codon:yes stop_codon:yes gene_type:complete